MNIQTATEMGTHDPDMIYQDASFETSRTRRGRKPKKRYCKFGNKLAYANGSSKCFACQHMEFEKRWGHCGNGINQASGLSANKASAINAQYDGKPCVKCGGTRRYASNMTCVACAKRHSKRARNKSAK